MSFKIKMIENEKERREKAFIHWKSWHDTYPGLVRQDYLEKFTLEKCERMALAWQGNSIIATDRDRVVGFLDYSSPEYALSDGKEIVALYVLSEYRGKGIGRSLMNAFLDEEEPGTERICLWVLKENERAIHFYTKCGFQADGSEKFVESIGASGIRMTLIR